MSESVVRRLAGLLNARTAVTAFAIAAMMVVLPGCPGTVDPCADADCSDGDLCTQDVCSNGVDAEGNDVAVCSNPPVECAEGVCDPADGECVECLVNADCGPLQICNDMMECEVVECLIDQDCDDGDDCTVDVCDNAEGGTLTCSNDPLCEEGQECVEGECFDTCEADADCDDGDNCTDDVCADGLCESTPVDCGDDVCNPEDGACVDCLSDDDCDGDDTCVDNVCTAPAPDCTSNGDCEDDGNFCTGDPVCTDGACGFTGDPCADNETCNEDTDACDPIAGDTFELTAETDTIVGTGNADTIEGPANTLNQNDIVDGGAGQDTLNAQLVGFDLSAGGEIPTLVDVEIVNLESRASANVWGNNGEQPGMFNIFGNADLTFDAFDPNQETTLTLQSFTETLAVDMTGNLAGTEDALSLSLDNVGVGSADVEVTVDGDDLETVNVESVNGPNQVNVTLTTGGGAIGEWVFTGDSDLTVEGPDALFDGVDGDADDFTGMLMLRADVDGSGSLDITGFSGGPASVTLFDSGAGAVNTTFTTPEGVPLTVDDTIGDLDVTVDGAGDAGQTNNSFELNVGGTEDDEDVDTGDVTVDDVENIVINSMNADDDDPENRVNTIEDLIGTAIANVDVGGDTALTFTDPLNLAGGIDFDATDLTGDLTADFTGAAGNDLITGGEGDDDLTISAGQDAVDGGPGDDTITNAAGNDLVTLGDGADVFTLVSLFANGPTDIDGVDIVTDFGADDALAYDSGTAPDFSAALTNNGACTANSIDISNDGTDTTILVDIDLDAGETCVETTLEGVEFTDADFEWNDTDKQLQLQ